MIRSHYVQFWIHHGGQMSTLIRRKWTRVAFQGGFPVLLRRHVSQAAHGAFFVEELDIARDRGGDVLGVAGAEVDEHLPA